MKTFKVILSMICLIIKCHSAPWGEQPVKGWLWYKHTPKKIPPKQTDKATLEPKSIEAKQPKTLTFRDRLKKEQEELEELQARAVVEPTLQNVQAFQRAQNLLLNQSEHFGKLWMLASLLDARNYKESSQPYPLHRKIYKENEEKQLDKQIKEFAKKFGLFFIFKKDCPYCHEFAPIVREFINEYGFQYKAISPDGHPLSEFPDAVADNGAIKTINKDGIYPTLYLVNPETRDVIPLSRGLVNLEELRRNMKLIIETLGRKSHG